MIAGNDQQFQLENINIYILFIIDACGGIKMLIDLFNAVIGQEVSGAAATLANRQLLVTYLTEPLDIDQNEEYGQKQKCPLGDLDPYSNARCPYRLM